jgi:hypothetical protein
VCGLPDVDPGVVHQDVESTEMRDGFGEHRVDRRLDGDVDAQRDRLGAERLQLACGSARLLRVACGNDDASAGTRKAARHAQSDSAVAAGNDGDLALQIEGRHGRHRYSLPWFTVIGDSLFAARP